MKKWLVGWGPIANCNLNCEFCYSKDARLKEQKVGYLDWIKFIDDNHKHIDSINYGTGENTLSTEWFDLIYYIRSKYPNIAQALTTNGYLIEQVNKDKKIAEIAKKSIDEIDVSLDFADEKQYCKFRGNEKVYRWALDTLQFCQTNNITGTIVFIGGAPILDVGNIDGIFNIAKEYAAKVRMNIYRPTNTSKEVNDRFIAPFSKIIDILYHINNNYKILSISDPLFSSILTDDAFEKDPSGNSSVRILHNGNITPSTYLITDNFQKCNIKEKNIFQKIEENKLFGYMNVVPEECSGCKFCETCCGGVYDRRYLWYKDFNKRDPYCPFLQGNFLPENKVKVHMDEGFESVHHGYLPSLCFTN